MQQGFVRILIPIAVLVILASSVYIYSKNENKTDDSPIKQNYPQRATDVKYRNDQLGFEFTVPAKDFLVGKDSEEDFNKRGNGDFRKNFSRYVGYEPAKVLGAVVILGKDQSFDEAPLTIWVFENSENLSAGAWYDKYWYYPFIWGDFDYSKERIKPQEIATISGQLGKYGIVTYRPSKPKFIYLPFMEKIFLFRVLTEDGVGDQILSTFKFLK